MRSRKALMAFALVAALGLVSCSSGTSSTSESSMGPIPSAFADKSASGEALANAWFGLLSLTGNGSETAAVSEERAREGMDLVRPYVDPAFQIQRASGERSTAGNFLPLDIDEFEISDVVVTSPREAIRVVRYTGSTPGATDLATGQVMSADPGPRLSVFRWDEALRHWVMVSHANFNFPTAAICDQAPITVTGDEPTTSPEDVALGESFVAEWRDITMGKQSDSAPHPEWQIQLADGQGWPSADGSEIEWSPAAAYDYDHLAVTRNEDLLVASYDAVTSDLEMEGAEYRSSASPRLLTYLRNDDGEWEMIALANFTVPTEVPDSVDCVATASTSS